MSYRGEHPGKRRPKQIEDNDGPSELDFDELPPQEMYQNLLGTEYISLGNGGYQRKRLREAE